MQAASLKEVYRRLILEVLCSSERPLSFPELVEALESRLGSRVNRYIARQVVGDLVREGKVWRRPDYERRLMVFEVPRCEG